MTEIEMERRVREALHRMEVSGASWGQIIIEISQGEPKHVNVVMEVIPEDPRDRGKLTTF